MKSKKRSSHKSDKNLLVGLDLGTSNTRVIIAQRGEESLNVIGLGSSPSLGMKHGVVVNIEQTVEGIISAVEQAENMADTTITSAYVVISGDHVRSVNSKGMVAVGKSGNGQGLAHKISQDDIQRVIATAQTVTLPTDREVVHVVPQDYLVDDREGFRDPLGIAGLRLEANVHIITAAITAAQTIQYCLQEAKVIPEELVFPSLAASLAVLTEDERELGVALVDIGGGTADLAVFEEGAIRHTAVIGLGGEDVTRDLAHGLRISRGEAEKLKLEYGCAHPGKLHLTEPIPLSSGEDRPDRQVAQDIVCAVIQPRMEEIFDLIIRELRQADYMNRLTSGVVLTGGGSLITGAVDLAEEAFAMPARLGKPRGLEGLRDLIDSPIYAVPAGLILYAAQQQDREIKIARSGYKRRALMRHSESKIVNIKQWITDMF
ncbi:MAG: cell division protein FtsA [bacterium]|nr:cell division protein FtsA [bacterium]